MESGVIIVVGWSFSIPYVLLQEKIFTCRLTLEFGEQHSLQE
jgi:hypothetical protein